MCSRDDDQYHTSDLISDVLSNGDSSRLFVKLVKEKNLFSDIHAYITGDRDEGLFIFSGKLVKGVTMEEAEKALSDEIKHIIEDPVTIEELEKVKNKIESTLEFSEISVLNKAMNLAYSELLGDAGLINREKDLYSAVTRESIQQTAKDIFRDQNCSTLYYYAN